MRATLHHTVCMFLIDFNINCLMIHGHRSVHNEGVSNMQQHDYDKILYRLINIISRLSDGEILYKDALALEFNVSTKTIQRDFNERLVLRFPIHKIGNGWKMMEGYHLEKSRAVEDILVVDILKTISEGFGKSFAKRSSSLLNKLWSDPTFVDTI